MTRLHSILLASVFLLTSAQQALADAIDGDWCRADGRRMSIRGPNITTPGGHQITGQYSRHAFTYTIPLPEPSAGATVSMRLVNPEKIDLWIGSQSLNAAPMETWSRCTPISRLQWQHCLISARCAGSPKRASLEQSMPYFLGISWASAFFSGEAASQKFSKSY
jgi:hypothetical protein